MLTVKRACGHAVGMVAKSQSARDRAHDPVVEAWLAECRSPNTRAAYAADFRHFNAWCEHRRVDPLALEPGDLAQYRAHCETGGARTATIARRLSAIASFGTFAVGIGRARHAPDVERPAVEPSTKTGLLTEAEATALLAAADAMTPRSAALVRLLMLDGLKVGETVQADATDVGGRPPRMTLALRSTARVVELHPETAAALHAYLVRRRRGPLILSEVRAREPERLTRFGVDYVVKQVAAAAGVRRSVSGNTLRRRYVVAAHERGDDIDDIRRSAGHADVRTTRRYLDSR
jgi:integrase/recombinase XerD